MTDTNPITLPPELVLQWIAEIRHEDDLVQVAPSDLHLAIRAAQWGADQELEACCKWFQDFYKFESWMPHDLKHLRADCRPKPQTLTSVALQMLDTIERDAHYLPEITDTIRRALVRLKQLENSND